MRTLSALGLFVSVIGLLLVCYIQFGIVPMLHDLNSDVELTTNEFTISLHQEYKNNLVLLSTVALIIGVFSVLFCSLLYLRKKTRMTMIGTILGFITATIAIIHSWF